MNIDEFFNEIDRNILDRDIAFRWAGFIHNPSGISRQSYINHARLHILPEIKEPYARQLLENVLNEYNQVILS